MKKLEKKKLLSINGGRGGNYTLVGEPKKDIKTCILSLFKDC
ncbi:EntF family bacteriocin induction factor [Macrococcoides caseolyticum]|nr:EntF family bacteriocin induction factor [Macrococcus caseolyticus]PNZ71601.1 EntF family bacteriocin induction factor [Macrococcus caseolyticus]